ncbi:hypothetical protein KSP39_PZI020008 [Platanthera zijinensis]|uniref:Uncharacterized protein n=1 Tax=Platanthera zijinensis TaxID=2320716 RepID=A0AAP0B121_9ASPA
MGAAEGDEVWSNTREGGNWAPQYRNLLFPLAAPPCNPALTFGSYLCRQFTLLRLFVPAVLTGSSQGAAVRLGFSVIQSPPSITPLPIGSIAPSLFQENVSTKMFLSD